jgi:hypothetical protein
LPGQRAPFEFQDVAFRHRQKVLDVGYSAKHHGPIHGDIRQDNCGSAVGDRRAIGSLERPSDERVLVALVATEIEAEVLADLS